MMLIQIASAVLALGAVPAGADLMPPVAAAAAVEQGQGQRAGQPQQRGNAGSAQQARGAQVEARGNQGQGQARREQPAERGNQGQGQARQQRPAQQGNQGQARQQRPAQQGNQGQRKQTPARSADQDRPRPQQPGNSGSAVRRSATGASNARGGVSPARLRRAVQSLDPEVRRLASSTRPEQRIAAGAAARAVARGLAPSALLLASRDDGIRIANRRNELLLDLDRRDARDLGYWEMRRLGDQRPHSGSPSFCRSGEGHPVWGREWCIRQGFGLGGDDVLWSRARVDDVIFGRGTDRDRLDRASLGDVLGDIVFGRLALHALTLGYDDPLTGRWVTDPDGPRLLRVYSGDRQVAELLDSDRDDHVEVVYVVQLR